MPKDPTPTRVLSICLLKESSKASDAIDSDKETHKRTFKFADSTSGTLYAGSSQVHPPKWASFIAESVDIAKLDLRSATASAVVLVPVKKRLFALTFGYGRFLLRPESIEQNFGLRATLNSVDADRIRSIDKKTFEGIATHTREQASKETAMGAFGIDVERDVLRAVVGSPKDEHLAIRMAGMDALTATCKVSFRNIPGKLHEFLEKSQDNSYKKAYPWIDNISEVRDPALATVLDQLLVDAIAAGSLANIWLAVPDPLEWSDVAGFRYSRSDKDAAPLTDVHMSTFLETVDDVASVTIDVFRHAKVIAIGSTTGEATQAWPVYKCIYAEVEHSGATFLLTSGQWYKVDSNFVKTINKHVSAIPHTTGTLLPHIAGESEEQYNVRLAASIPGACCLDRKLISYGGGRSKIEFCDVLSPDRRMFHVKKYTGSSVLSHLFAQGSVAATAMLSDEGFRTAVNGIIPTTGMQFSTPSHTPKAADHEVAYVVTSKSNKKLTLPFFSRVTLRNASTQLQNYGFKVTLTKVGVA